MSDLTTRLAELKAVAATMGEFVPPLTFERLDDGTIRVTDNTIQDAVRDVVKRLADAEETALKEAIKSLGWIAPEDIAAHDAQVAAQALRKARDMLANSPAVTIAGPGGALELLDAEIDRIETQGRAQ